MSDRDLVTCPNCHTRFYLAPLRVALDELDDCRVARNRQEQRAEAAEAEVRRLCEEPIRPPTIAPPVEPPGTVISFGTGNTVGS